MKKKRPKLIRRISIKWEAGTSEPASLISPLLSVDALNAISRAPGAAVGMNGDAELLWVNFKSTFSECK